MRLTRKKAERRLVKRQAAYSRTMGRVGFLNTTCPGGIGNGGYKPPGSAKRV